MSTLATAVRRKSEQQAAKRSQEVIRAVKTRAELQLSASASEEFFFVKIPLNKIALSASSKCDGATVIVDKNVDRVGRTVGGFIPKIFILAGHNTVAEAKAENKNFINVWAGRNAIKKLRIMADDAISTNELQNKLAILIGKRYKNPNTDTSMLSNGPWIRDIYPFENYVIFENNGDLFKQAFILDPINRNVALSGAPMKVYQEYSDSPKGLTSTEGKKAKMAEQVISAAAALPVMPSQTSLQMYTTTLVQEDMYDMPNNGNKPLGLIPGTGIGDDMMTIRSFGAPTSEASNPPLKTMTNIEEALRIYLAMIADGTHTPMPPMFNPSHITASRYPNEYRECEIAAHAVKEQISVLDFMRWQDKQLKAAAKLKHGLQASAFAYVGDKDDISTWHCQCDSKKAIKASLKTLHNSSVPKAMQAQVRKKLEAKKSKKDVDAENLVQTPQSANNVNAKATKEGV